MSISPKYFLYAVLGFFSLIGLLVCSSVVCAFFSNQGTKGFVGTVSCSKSRSSVYRYLPLPEQTEPTMPMAVDERALLDNWGFVIFRAPADWQEAFRAFYPLEGELSTLNSEEAERMAQRLDDPRIHHFITSRKWQPFHASQPRPGFFISALRDESGEYLLVYFMNL